jgi:hypothetical protein
MSAPSEPGPPPPPLTAAQGAAQGCLAVFLFLLGIVMVLPGLCSLVVATMSGGDMSVEFVLLWIITFVIAAGGIMLLRHARQMARQTREAREVREAVTKIENTRVEDKETR